MTDISEAIGNQIPLLIRRAEEKDIPAITSIYNDAVLKTAATFHIEPVSSEERYEWFLLHDNSRRPVIVAQSEDTLVGWASLSQWNPKPAYDGSAELSVYVARNARGGGVGKALMEDLIRRAEQAELHTIISLITEGNEVSMKLHAQLGFEQTGIIREAGFKFDQYLDVSIWQKIL
ncbi:MAG: GNAT family N-acetyltransferase [Spirochaetales bacterium]|nr:GNAT family N-acetyltransferase [Spirochaetales bacterium]